MKNNPYDLTNLEKKSIQQLGENYFISAKGIYKKDFRAKDHMIPITFCKLLTVDKKWINHLGELSYDLVFEFENSIKKVTVSHQMLLSKEISKLSMKGVPIDQNFLKDISNALFLIGSEIKSTQLVSQLGFCENGEELRFIGVESSELFEITLKNTFDFQTKGTEEEEVDAVRELICPHPGLLLAYCLGLSSIMIFLLNYKEDCDLFFPFYYLTGDSSKGKTTATMAAISAFGNSNPKNGSSFVQAFSSTENALIKTMTNFNGFAIGVDDMGSTAGNRNAFIYSAVNGREKSRSLSDGSVVPGSGFNVVAIGNGEVSLSENLSDHAGAQLRIMEFDIPLTESQKHSEQIKKSTRKFYGHIAKQFADQLLALDFIEVINQYEKNLKLLLGDVDISSSKIVRYTKQLSAVLTTIDYFCIIFHCEVNRDEIIKLLKNNQVDRLDKLEYTKISYLKLKNYIYQNLDKFDNNSTGENFGFINEKDNHVEVAIITTAMKDISKELDLPDTSVFMKALRDKDFLVTEKNRLTKKIKGFRCHVIKFDNWKSI